MDLYAENILDHYKHPRHHGSLPDASAEHTEKNLTCGDSLTLSIRMDGDRIAAVGWTGEGCAISQAGMSILSEELTGKTANEAAGLTGAAVREMLGVPVGTRRLKCALLCLHTLKNTLRAHAGKEAQGWAETVGNAEETR